MKTLLSLFALPAVIFAQDAAPSAQGGMTQTVIMIGIALLFFYSFFGDRNRNDVKLQKLYAVP